MAFERLKRLMAFALLLAVHVTAGAAGQVFCCNDATGTQVCSDILPQACVGRAYREVGKSGTTSRRIEAPLTAEQRAQQKVEEDKRRIEEEKRKERQRKDQALLDTYGNERDIDAMRIRAESDIFQSIRNAETKIEETRLVRKKFEDEAEFYKKKTLPGEVRKGLVDTEFEIRAQESIIESKKKELDAVRAKYSEEKARFQELSRRPPAPR